MTTNIRLLFATLALAVSASACSNETTDTTHYVQPLPGRSVWGLTDHAILVQARDSFTILLATIGTGEYRAPKLSSDGMQLTGITNPVEFNPGGIKQVFHFTARKPGTYVLAFPHVDGDEVGSMIVVDTVLVQ